MTSCFILVRTSRYNRARFSAESDEATELHTSSAISEATCVPQTHCTWGACVCEWGDCDVDQHQASICRDYLWGCTDFAAVNFNALATNACGDSDNPPPDGYACEECVPRVFGCTTAGFYTYDSMDPKPNTECDHALCDDTCQATCLPCADGACKDPLAVKYDLAALVEDISECVYAVKVTVGVVYEAPDGQSEADTLAAIRLDWAFLHDIITQTQFDAADCHADCVARVRTTVAPAPVAGRRRQLSTTVNVNVVVIPVSFPPSVVTDEELTAHDATYSGISSQRVDVAGCTDAAAVNFRAAATVLDPDACAYTTTVPEPPDGDTIHFSAITDRKSVV